MDTTHWRPDPRVQAWLASPADVPAEAWERLYQNMDPQRQARCQRYRREGDRRRCILADALARHALSALTGADPQRIRFARTQDGKPYAPDLNVHFSLSHSGALVLCAAAPFPVGADVQRHRSVSPALVQRMARASYPGGSSADFFAWWTRQEAAGKLTGRGLSLSPLPAGLRFWEGETCHGGERYAHSICAHAQP